MSSQVQIPHGAQRPDIIAYTLQNFLWKKLSEIANNLSCANVVGFKATTIKGQQIAKTDKSLGQMSTVYHGTMLRRMDDGAIRFTDCPLDIALSGKGFLSVETPNGVRYTRCGQLAINANGVLVTRGDQYPVLDQNGQEIVLPENDPKNISFSKDGYVFYKSPTHKADNQDVSYQLGIFEFSNPNQLISQGQTLLNYESDQKDDIIPSLTTNVVQYAVEDANVIAVEESLKMVELLRTYEHAQKMIEQHEQMQNQKLRIKASNA
jgi:flagellar basal-body rod protein FlgF